MISYDTNFKKNFSVLFDNEEIENCLGKWVSPNGSNNFE